MMTVGLSARLRRTATIATGAFIGVFLLAAWTGIRINASPSLPIGLYIATTDVTATLVEFCPPEPAASLAIRRGYRTRGSCPDGASPLLKPVIAKAGDLVQTTDQGIRVNGVLIRGSRPLRIDTSGRPMPVWPSGLEVVPPGCVWVASSYNPRSFDSRYFGPISLSSIRARLRPLLTE